MGSSICMTHVKKSGPSSALKSRLTLVATFGVSITPISSALYAGPAGVAGEEAGGQEQEQATGQAHVQYVQDCKPERMADPDDHTHACPRVHVNRTPW